MELLRNVPTPLTTTALETTPQSQLNSTLPLSTLSVGQRASSTVVFIDAGVSDFQSLAAGVQPGAEVYVLDPAQDAIAQITQTLLGKTGVSSVQIVSHGEVGGVKLGTDWLDLANIRSYADQLHSWGNALAPNADILLYGCDVAEGDSGHAFVNFMSQLTGADVAASTDLTGKGGNWTLEYSTGKIEAAAAFSASTLAAYDGTLNATLGSAGTVVSFTEKAANPTLLFSGTGTVVNSPTTSTSWNGITLTVNIATAGEASDRLSLRAGNNVSLSADLSTVLYRSVAVGTVTGGTGTTPLVITFNNAASRQSAAAVLNQIQFANTSNNPSSLSRSITAVMAAPGPSLGNIITQTVNVIPVNDAPTITGFSKSGLEDTPITFAAADFTSTYADAENTPLNSIKVSVLPTLGTLALNGTAISINQAIASADLANLVYVPNLNVNTPTNGADQFTWSASDGALDSTPAKVTISLGPVNDAPTVSDVAKTGSEDTLLSLSSADFVAGFSDVDGNTLNSIQIVSGPSHGVLSYNGALLNTGVTISAANISNISYLGDANYNGNDSFTWIASDGALSSVAASTFNITLTPVNDAPAITGYVLKTNNEDTLFTFTAADFSSQVTDVDTGDSLAMITVTFLPSQGTLKLNNVNVTANQVILAANLAGLTYLPNANVNGSDSFGWTAGDGNSPNGTSEQGLVGLTINPVNDPAVITSFVKPATEDTAFNFNLSDFAGPATFSDVDGNTLSSIKIISLPVSTLTLASNIQGGAPTPVTVGQILTAAEIPRLTYNPVLNLNGQDQFSWAAFDGSTDISNIAQVTVSLAAVNDPPTISNLSKTQKEDTLVTFTQADFAGKFSDVDGNAIAGITVLDLPTFGTLSLGAIAVTSNQFIAAPDLASLTYLSELNYNGPDNFAWTASDGTTDAVSPAQVSLTITPVNDPPVVNSVIASPDEDVLYHFDPIDFTSQYTDVENSPLSSITITDLPTNGFLVLQGATASTTLTAGRTIAAADIGKLSYISKLNFNGADSFGWTASDGQLNAVTPARVSLMVAPVNDPPTLGTLTKNAQENVDLTISAANFGSVFSDVDAGDTMQSIRITDLPSHGNLVLRSTVIDPITSIATVSDVNVPFNTPLIPAAAGGFFDAPPSDPTVPGSDLVYIPDPDYFGADAFQWTASDGQADSAVATANVNVARVNKLPTIASDINVTGLEEQPIAFTTDQFASLFSDTDGGTFTSITVVSRPQNGILMLGTTTVTGGQVIAAADIATLTYKGNPNFFGADSFTWNLSDGQSQFGSDLAANPALVSISLANVNDAPTFSIGSTLLTTMVGNPVNTLTSFISGFNPGPNESSSQSLAGYSVLSVSNPSLFLGQPTLDNTGNFTFQAAASGTGGIATVVVQALDSGDTTNGGVNATTKTLSIAVAPRPVVSLLSASPATLTESDSSTFTFQVSLSTASTQTVRVAYSTVDGTATAASNDYVALNDVLTFNPGQTLQTITVTARGNSVIEPNETFGLSLTGVTNGDLGTLNQATTTIINNDFTEIADFNHDGKPDIVWRNDQTGEVYVWTMNGANRIGDTFLKKVVDASGANDPNWQIQSLADFTGDGQTDILWRNVATGDLLVWEMNGTQFVQDVFIKDNMGAAITNIDPSWQIKEVADFNLDGHQDLFWVNNKTGETYFWEMNGSTRTLDMPSIFVGTSGWQVEGTGDFNGDGNVDLLWRNVNSGALTIWEMNGFDRIKDVPVNKTVLDPGWTVEGIADFTNDGKVDVLWRNVPSGINLVWEMNGTATVNDLTLPVVNDLNWEIAGVADYLNNGSPDVLWRNYSTGDTLIWNLNGTTRIADVPVTPAITDVDWEVNPIATA